MEVNSASGKQMFVKKSTLQNILETKGIDLDPRSLNRTEKLLEEDSESSNDDIEMIDCF